MKSTKILLLATILFALSQDVFSQSVPAITASRRVNWNNAGLYANETPQYATHLFNITKYQGTADQQVQAALNDAKKATGTSIIYFPQGRYILYAPLELTYNDDVNNDCSNIIFQGDGSDKTFLVFLVGKDGTCFKISGSIIESSKITLTNNINKGTKSLIGPMSSFQVNDWIRLCENNLDMKYSGALVSSQFCNVG